MSCINADTKDFWQDLANRLSAKRPSVGKRVKSLTVRGKAKGVIGVVVAHERDRFDGTAWRYGSDADHHYRELEGTYGFRVQIRDERGNLFWVSATRVEVLP